MLQDFIKILKAGRGTHTTSPDLISLAWTRVNVEAFVNKGAYGFHLLLLCLMQEGEKEDGRGSSLEAIENILK